MLVVTRKNGQKIMINDDIEVTIVDSRMGVCKVAINAPRHYKIYREEIYMQIKLANLMGQSSQKDAVEKLSDIVESQKELINNDAANKAATDEVVLDENNSAKKGRIFINKKKPVDD
ncbi:carbon storage regulator [bacterium]|nr:carbon storage regulator [bacterium]